MTTTPAHATALPAPPGGGKGALAGAGALTSVERAQVWLPVTGAHGAVLPPAVARTVAVADECGAPHGPALAAAAAAADHRRRLRDELDRTIAPAVAVARGLLALPVVTVPLLARILGVDPAAFFVSDPYGRLVGGLVVLLLAAAATWMHLLVRGARRAAPRPGRAPALAGALLVGLAVGWWAGAVVAAVAWWRRPRRGPGPHAELDEAADLVATAMAAGHDAPGALRLVARHVADDDLARGLGRLALLLSLVPPTGAPAVGPAAETAVDPGVAPLGELLAEITVAGSPASDHLRALAVRLRARRAAATRTEVARLPARLTFPTALLLVPATVLAIGAPVVVRGLSALAGT